VVDWTPLIAGPSACAALAEAGAEVVRIEHPGRPDGLRSGDPALWDRLNGAKRLLLADAATPAGRRAVAEALRWADLVVSGNSLRVLPQLGFTDDWFRERAPRAALFELVAYLPPDEDQPGLGEHAAAVAGLLWSRGARPRPPRPWADPLAGALCALLATAWEYARRPAGARLRVSLEGAAGLAL
jgi:crotonobetainyl-CoA:carnitine CoA-transferase CaiB-like acyl-CoA transferase